MDIPLKVLIYNEENEWVAHLLEMDLVGTGDSEKEAVKDLMGAYEAQVSFCIQENLDPYRPAPESLFEAWDEIQQARSQSMLGGRTTRTPKRQASFIGFNEEKARQSERGNFVLA